MEATGTFPLEDHNFSDRTASTLPPRCKFSRAETNKVYPIENYGSSMAPFYLLTFHLDRRNCLVAMLKVTVSENGTTGLKHLKLHQIYLGRYLIFLILGLLQSTLICLRSPVLPWHPVQAPVPLPPCRMDIQHRICQHHLHADCLLRRYRKSDQCCASGYAGSREPAELSRSKSHRDSSKRCIHCFHFTHSMAALREAVSGLYGGDYWIILKLYIFLLYSDHGTGA